jgi:hypothetical protein
MAIIVGDVHGNVEKVRAFLDYKPQEEHIALGDYVDSFHEPQTRQIETLQLLLDSKAVLLWGNHDVHYLKPPPWICTGFQHGKEKPLRGIIEANKHRFKAAYVIDGWLLTHAGVHIRVARPLRCAGNVAKLAEKLNAEMLKFLEKPTCYQHPTNGWLISHTPAIFNIGQGRGGDCNYGGIFWYDYKREPGLDTTFKQIFGHTETKEGPVVTENYICLDTTNNKSTCWFYDTAVNELVEVLLPRRNALISDLPEEEQEPFRKFLLGQTIPEADGYYEEDYRRWTRLKRLGLVLT